MTQILAKLNHTHRTIQVPPNALVTPSLWFAELPCKDDVGYFCPAVTMLYQIYQGAPKLAGNVHSKTYFT